MAKKNLQKNPQNTRSVLSPEQKRVRRFREKENRISFRTNEYGYISSDGKKIPDEYLVRITSLQNNVTIVAPFQEDISLGVESHWEPVVPAALLRTINTVAQTATGRSAITSATTRRMWQGTSPISVSLRLKFEAVNDPFVEVVEACRLLQAIAVPSNPSSASSTKNAASNAVKRGIKGIGKTLSDLPALLPPGPSPFTWDKLLAGETNFTDKTRSDIEKSAKGGDFIMIELGTFLTFWKVIVRESNVSYKSRFSPEGYPIAAEAEIVFETYEMPTKEALEYSYTKIIPVQPEGPRLDPVTARERGIS